MGEDSDSAGDSPTLEERRERRKKRKRDEKRDRRKEEIKNAAIDVFADKGFHAAKVSDIVSSVGVAQGTFYLYYDGKEQIFEEILQDFLRLLLDTVANWEPGSLDSREALGRELRRIGRRLTDIIDERQRLASIYFKESMSAKPEFESLVRGFHETLISMLTGFNEILHDRGLIESADFRLMANMTVGMVERIIMEYVVHDNFEDVPHEKLVEHLVVHYMSGTREPIDVEPSETE